jgi:hypothetical protein
MAGFADFYVFLLKKSLLYRRIIHKGSFLLLKNDKKNKKKYKKT